MEGINLKAAAEAILFSTGDSVELTALAAALEIESGQARKLMEEMAEEYDRENRGIRLANLDGAYQLCTKKEYYDYLVRIALHPKKAALTEVMMETLSIVAYKQPVTRIEIENIRGVKSDHAINRLVEYGLVQEVGRLDAPGRPLLFGTTEEFLRSFGVSSSKALPELNPLQIEDFRAEAEEEISRALNRAEAVK